MPLHDKLMLRPYCLAIASIVFAFALLGCGNSNEHQNHDHENHQDSNHKQSATSADPAATKLADATTAADDYPLTTCVVSGEDLAAMGGHVSIQHEGREVRFCCKECVKTFKDDPAKYLALLDKAASGQSRTEHDTAGHDDHDHTGHDH